MTSRLDAHARNCHSDDCPACESVYDLRIHPDAHDPEGRMADRAADGYERWLEGSWAS